MPASSRYHTAKSYCGLETTYTSFIQLPFHPIHMHTHQKLSVLLFSLSFFIHNSVNKLSINKCMVKRNLFKFLISSIRKHMCEAGNKEHFQSRWLSIEVTHRGKWSFFDNFIQLIESSTSKFFPLTELCANKIKIIYFFQANKKILRNFYINLVNKNKKIVSLRESLRKDLLLRVGNTLMPSIKLCDSWTMLE